MKKIITYIYYILVQKTYDIEFYFYICTITTVIILLLWDTQLITPYYKVAKKILKTTFSFKELFKICVLPK